jgi:hypothetical protein
MTQWLLAALLCASAARGQATCASGTVHYDALTAQHTFHCVGANGAGGADGAGADGADGAAAAATGTYDDDGIATTGWGSLRITTHAAAGANATAQAYAAGMLEGRLTQHRMSQYWRNYAANNYGAKLQPCPALQTFMAKQQAWLRAQVRDAAAAARVAPRGGGGGAAGGGDDAAYWGAAGALLAQFDGLTAGYAAAAPAAEALDSATLYLLNAVGDLETLNGAFCPGTAAAATARLRPAEAPMLDCSALIRLLPDDVLAAHATWRGYYAMLRAWKTYDFSSFLVPAAAARGGHVGGGRGGGAQVVGGGRGIFSIASSPGLLHSKDDFYARGDGLVAMETTNGIYNRSLLTPYALLPAESALSWQRAMVANWLAEGGRDWTDLFRKHNSGTYNNQWMALDGGRARRQMAEPPRHAAPSGWLWILEQIPGATVTADVTDVLRARGFWPSYNIPYFETIYNASGYAGRYEAALNASGGVPGPASDAYAYEGCPRARIFARDAPAVASLAGMRATMTYNGYQTDPLALGSPSGAIAARGDLAALSDAPLTHRLSAGGAVDAKVVSVAALATLQATKGPAAAAAAAAVHAICGPTHAQQAPFAWATANASITEGVARDGVPAAFDFDWTTFPLL